ncbi:MAG: hypothetical protein QXL15_04685 [Candidatus Korarchaeota archaeon]
MSSKESKRVSTVKDRWKSKKWMAIELPHYLGRKKIAEIPVTHSTIGRTIEIYYSDITENIEDSDKKIKLQVIKESENIAKTEVKKYEIRYDVVNGRVRRGTTLVETIFDVETKDKYKYRLRVMAIVKGRAKRRQAKMIRKIAVEFFTKKANTMTHGQFLEGIVNDSLNEEYRRAIFHVAPIEMDSVEVIKLKTLTKLPELIKKAEQKAKKETAVQEGEEREEQSA